MAQGQTENVGVRATDTTLLVPEHSRQGKRLQRKELQISLNNDLLSILDELEIEEGLSRMQTLLNDCRWNTLYDLIEEMKNWDVLTTIPEPKTFLFNSKIQPTFGKILERNIFYQPYLECFITRFSAYNERIVPELNAPIHYAVESLNVSLITWLLSQPSIDINIRNKQSKTALFLLCEQYDAVVNSPKFKKRALQLSRSPIKAEDIRQCILLLLDHGADFNVCSDRLKLPFEHLSRNSSNENKTFLMECVARFKGAIAVGKRGGAKQLCLGFYQDWVPVNITVQLLEIMLRFKDIQRFDREFQKFKVDECNVRCVIRLLLHIAVELDMERTVKKIVEHAGQIIFKTVKPVVSKKRAMRVCPPDQEQDAKTSELVYRVELKGLLKKACECGNVATLTLLLGNITDRVLVNDDPILVFTLNRAQELWRREEERIRVLQCAELLAKDQKIYLTRTDNNGNTALHTSLKFGFNDIALDLMQQKYAFLGARNKDNQTPLDFARFDFWKMYFDQCVTIDVRRSYFDRNEIRLNLNGFDPYIFKKRQTKKASPKDRSEMNLWRIVEKASSTNVSSQQPHESFVTEMDPVKIIAKSKELKRLLLHPVIYTFILVKWLRLTKWIYLNLICTLATVICFGMHSLDTCNGDNHSSIIVTAFTWIGAVYMISREIVQILFLRLNYFSSFDNYVDIATIISMVIVLQDGCRSILSSLIVIAFALQLTVLIGSLPFNTLSTYMHMFKTVSVNFMKSFLLFIPLLGAFTYSFFLSYNDRTIPRNATNEEVPFNTFSSFSDAALKTLVMTTGEYEAAGVDFSGGKIVLFVLFIFFAPIVVLNLINGLAVSDITSIKEESELISLRKKVLILERYERGLRDMPIQFIRRMFPTSFFENHSYVIVVKPKELRKILVQQINPQAGNQPREQNLPKGVWCVVPNMPGGWLVRGSEGFFVNLKFLKFPLFCTLDEHIMDEALQIVDASIMLREIMDTKRMEIASSMSSFTESDDKLDEMKTEITKMRTLLAKVIQQKQPKKRKFSANKTKVIKEVDDVGDKLARATKVAKAVGKFKKGKKKPKS
ncbi:transient receptor potential cation channel protein painless-like [Armigeres subalbatus]|uniref:transient receptor potential cation channel protein painless-like n=1 Tax=Armigeres subalbatus TaxID=124917 RepID=UPI002ED0FE52